MLPRFDRAGIPEPDSNPLRRFGSDQRPRMLTLIAIASDSH
jgi:hypothetical protein